MAVEIALSGGPVRIGAIAKGSGMIAPNMATMFCVITTDAAIEADALLCFANGQAGLPVLAPGTGDFAAFAEALREVCVTMAKALVRDGEGATKFVEIRVEGAASDEGAKTIARSIAQSQLCKTAFFGEDPNIGRLACAAGYAGVPFDVNDLGIWLDGVQVVQDGMPAAYEEEHAAAVMRQAAFTVRVSVGRGTGEAVFWTSDLSHDYVTINADYRT
jgi:glutamate N-acetyltransferase/amino-acid N-acetyltransferase